MLRLVVVLIAVDLIKGDLARVEALDIHHQISGLDMSINDRGKPAT
jgi:hypothetical protein